MSLRTDEYYLDVLCDIGPEEILKFTQFKVGTRHKLASAIKQYKSMPAFPFFLEFRINSILELLTFF